MHAPACPWPCYFPVVMMQVCMQAAPAPAEGPAPAGSAGAASSKPVAAPGTFLPSENELQALRAGDVVRRSSSCAFLTYALQLAWP